MTIRDRVVNTVAAWDGFSGFDTGESLSVLWSKSADGSTIPFKPQAVMILSGKLQTEFRSGQDARDLSRLNANSYAPGGSIDTVDDLVNAVMLAPPAVAVAAMAEPVTMEKAPVKKVSAKKKAAAKNSVAPKKKAAPQKTSAFKASRKRSGKK
jgi:hypothetical protein